MSCQQLVNHGRLLYSNASPCCTCIYRAVNKSFGTIARLNQNTTKLPLFDIAEDVQKRKDSNKKRKPKQKKELVDIYKNMTVNELSQSVNKSVDDVFDALRYVSPRIRYKGNSPVSDFKVIQNVVQLYGYNPNTVPRPDHVKKSEEVDYDIYPQPPPDPSKLIRRPPIVTIMGHVDHGKTTLLDALRNSNVVAQEFGGITQHIGAFSVNLPSGETISFLDTPGHAAFSSMRERGALVTDIVVLVVAADDGVMPTTVESIKHATNANVPVIVAINKIDKPESNIEKTERMLLQHGLIPESLGGDVQCVAISARKGTNLQQLQEAIITQAEILDIKGDPTGMVEGHVVESKTEPGRGKLATIIIQRGTLKKGDLLIAGLGWTKVRGIFTEKGTSLKQASLSMPVEVTGWRELPQAGDQVLQAKSDKILKEALTWRKNVKMSEKIKQDQEIIDEKREKHNSKYQAEKKIRDSMGINWRLHVRMKRKEGYFNIKDKEAEVHHEGASLSIVLKGDVNGSVEAILNTLMTYSSQKCRLDIIHYGVGEITINDVETTQLFDGEVFAFNVPVPSSVRDFANSNNVVIHEHNVIYKLFDQLKESLTGRLPMIEEEEPLGEANVLEIFNVTVNKKKIPVAGCRCTSGSLLKKEFFKLLRGDEEIYKGRISSLKHHKNEVEVIKKDFECGISLSDTKVEIQRGDVIVCYKNIEIQQEIDWDPGF